MRWYCDFHEIEQVFLQFSQPIDLVKLVIANLESETSLNLVIIRNKPILNFISKGGYMGNAGSVVGYFWYLCAMLIVDEIKDVKTAVENGLRYG